jgi:hypothetical protein
MPCYHHIDNRVIIKHKEQQCLQLANKWDEFIKSMT